MLCLQCAKVCPYDNIAVGIVTADAPVRCKALLKSYEAAFVMMALGFVAHEVIGEVKWLDAAFHFVPASLANSIPDIAFGWFEALWFLVLFPLVVWSVIAGVGYLAGHRHGLRSLLLAAATGAAPVVAIAHLAKATAKVSSWGNFLPLSLVDPQGLETFGQLADDSISRPLAMLGLPVLGWVMLALIVVIAWKAWRWSRQVPAEMLPAARCGLLSTVLLAIFGDSCDLGMAQHLGRAVYVFCTRDCCGSCRIRPDHVLRIRPRHEPLPYYSRSAKHCVSPCDCPTRQGLMPEFRKNSVRMKSL